MTPDEQPLDRILHSLQERAKELNCLYRVEEALNVPDRPLEETLRAVASALPDGWQFPEICRARVRCQELEAATPGFAETAWTLHRPILLQGEKVGSVTVAYAEARPRADEGPFLKEEEKLLETVAERIGQFLLHRDLRAAFDSMHRRAGGPQEERPQSWWVVLDMLRRTDRALVRRLARKMVNYLSYRGFGEARAILLRLAHPQGLQEDEAFEDNRPHRWTRTPDDLAMVNETFQIAAQHLSDAEILDSLQKWIKEEKIDFLLAVLESPYSGLADIVDALERYRHLGIRAAELSLATQVGLRVSLIRRIFTEQTDFLDTARRYLDLDDFHDLARRIIPYSGSRGKLGGKSSGLFLAEKILAKSAHENPELGDIRVPRTWYVPSDVLLSFIHYNNLEDVYNWKYEETEQIRQEYPHIVQVFKDSHFPPELVNRLGGVLDELGERPIIVRSSSLLEDRLGSAFSGKYKSLFLSNQGERAERLASLLDAMAEVWASIFHPDPIMYRAERGLLDLHEEMALMIQEVVGRRVGPYFLPAFAGVGFSHNEFRWSSRIRREDGLLRLVPGLGTRAVDRLTDDYPVLLAPGQPGLRVNVTADEVARYSPRRLDVINLETHQFESVDVRHFLRTYADDLPDAHLYVSVMEGDRVRRPSPTESLGNRDDVLITFEGLITATGLVPRLRAVLDLLHRRLGTPVDLEFAGDGKDLYLLQCRPQSFAADSTPSPIPADLPPERLLFNARRYISNGRVPDISHVVYVDPERYGALRDPQAIRQVGRAVGRLNKILPRRQFILMGPGRWGSRGDIKLGVSVTYSDLNNAAVLVEIARKKGNYVPDLSFGTHFFQDLVEASIRYLPLYPDEPGITFREDFFRGARNLLPELCPDFEALRDVVHVVDVAQASGGQVLRILLNADLDLAVGYLAPPGYGALGEAARPSPGAPRAEEHWRWRWRMAEAIAAALDGPRFGVRGCYLIGSTKHATAGPESDLDLLLHVEEDVARRRALEQWLEGWGRCLAELNFQRTGHRVENLLDPHFVTDADLERQSSFARMIGDLSDPARPLPLGARREPGA